MNWKSIFLKKNIYFKNERNEGKQPEEDYERASCKFCLRKFANDRIEKHEKVCEINYANKRKTFDSKKQRV